MQVIDNVATQDLYAAALTLEDPAASAGAFVVANNPVYAKFRARGVGATVASYGPEQLLPPQTNNVVGCTGMAFRTAISGSPAQVIAVLYDKDDPLLGSPTPFSAKISPSGAITPGVSSVQIQADGALVGTEPILDFLTGAGMKLVMADDAAGTRVTATLQPAAITDTLLAVTAAIVDIQNIPQTFASLFMHGQIGSDSAGDVDVYLRVNNRSTANYLWNRAKWIGGTPSTDNGGGGDTHATIGFGQANAGQVMNAPLWVAMPNYSNSGVKPQWLSVAGGNGFNALLSVASGSIQFQEAVTRWTLLAAAGSFRAGSRFTLAGVPQT